MNIDIHKLRQILSEAMDDDWGDDDPQASTEVESGEMEIEDEAGFSEWASKVIVSDHLSGYGLERPQQIPFYVDEEYNPIHNAYDAFREGMSAEAYAIKLAFLINMYGVELGRENVIRGDFDDYSLQAQFEDTLGGEELEAIGADYGESGDALSSQESEAQESKEDFVYVDVTTQGSGPDIPAGVTFELWDKLGGMETGFGTVSHPYFIEEGEPGYDDTWRLKDGRTVIGLPADHPDAIPVADAYFRLYKEWHDENEKTPIDKIMGWPTPVPWYEREPEEAIDWDAENLAKSIRSYEREMGWDPADPEDYVKTVGGYMIKSHEESDPHEDLTQPKHTGMGRRPGAQRKWGKGGKGTGTITESVINRWGLIAGIED